jgi:hypothetical protein
MKPAYPMHALEVGSRARCMGERPSDSSGCIGECLERIPEVMSGIRRGGRRRGRRRREMRRYRAYRRYEEILFRVAIIAGVLEWLLG